MKGHSPKVPLRDSAIHGSGLVWGSISVQGALGRSAEMRILQRCCETPRHDRSSAPSGLRSHLGVIEISQSLLPLGTSRPFPGSRVLSGTNKTHAKTTLHVKRRYLIPERVESLLLPLPKG